MLHKGLRRLDISKMDLIGGVTSGVCAIHCISIPLLLSFGTFGGLSIASHTVFDIVVIGLAIIIATWASIRGYERHHSWSPILIMILGTSMLLCGWFLNGSSSHFVMALGGSFLAFGHYWNYRLRTPSYRSVNRIS